MFIASCKVNNFKSFGSSQEIKLTPGFNVVVGKNNAGKTAFIEALSHQFPNKPHRTIATLPSTNSRIESESGISVRIGVTRKEAYDYLSEIGALLVPVLKDVQNRQARIDQTVSAWRDYLAQNCVVRYDYQRGKLSGAGFEGLPAGQSGILRVACHPGTEELYMPEGHYRLRDASVEDFAKHIAENSIQHIYIFRAERPNLSECASGTSEQLAPDARNLAEVLHRLQSNPQRFARFVKEVRTVLPDIMYISADLVSQQSVRVLVWPIEPETERQDLAVPLADCGTGVGQVLAILYVVFTSTAPRIIIIDEPQSFLHPGAVRKLFDVLKGYSQHQFIIPTHSPTVVTAANPGNMILLQLDNGVTKAETMNIGETNELRAFLCEIGARLSDVFGADRILWVEGRTEEICVRKIIGEVLKRPLFGTEIIGVRQVGDLQGRHARTVLEIYQRLCEGKGLLPPAVGFCFDREGLNEVEREELTKDSDGLVRFIPRRMYENYLLNPMAIAAVLNQATTGRNTTVTEEDVNDWIAKKGQGKPYFAAGLPNDWRRDVDSARLLNDMFNDLTDTRVCYNKTKHAPQLTDWIITNSPADLNELAEFLGEMLPKPSDGGSERTSVLRA